ncbi:MAG: hypothetical protein KZQ83_12935 [gamma proteobacterium symbiont of Taylorina sp.]|nr:hypothetical protein [gamma proteobacterium symbiont of Taylorina sp.]
MSSTNRGAQRHADDFYVTPKWCTESLLPLIDWTQIKTFHEPCKGSGAIYNRIQLDDENKYWSEIRCGRDYLNVDHEQVDIIITNPPYKLAREFIEKALGHGKTVIMLLRLNFLESQGRYEFWQANPPSHIITLSKRPSFTNKGTDSTGYAWFCWGGENVIKGHALQWIRESV